MAGGSVVIVGGTRGLGRELAQFYAGQGRDVVLTGRDAAPAVVGDSPRGRDMPEGRLQALVSRPPTGRLVTMSEVVDASRFLLENRAINGINLAVDGGWLCM